jgi:hypothetical protein
MAMEWTGEGASPGAGSGLASAVARVLCVSTAVRKCAKASRSSGGTSTAGATLAAAAVGVVEGNLGAVRKGGASGDPAAPSREGTGGIGGCVPALIDGCRCRAGWRTSSAEITAISRTAAAQAPAKVHENELPCGAGSAARRARTEEISDGGTSTSRALATVQRPALMDATRACSSARAARQAAQEARCERSARVAGAPAAAEFRASW